MGQRHLKKELKKIHQNKDVLKIISEICPKKIPPGQKKLERIANSVSFIITQQSEGKQYLHFCNYNSHHGVMGQKYLEKKGCLTINEGKKCPYYSRFFEE